MFSIFSTILLCSDFGEIMASICRQRLAFCTGMQHGRFLVNDYGFPSCKDKTPPIFLQSTLAKICAHIAEEKKVVSVFVMP